MPIPKEKAIFKYISKRNSSLFIIQWFLGLLLKWKSLVCLPSIHYPSFHKTLRLLRGLLTPTIPAQLLSPQLLLTLATVWFEGNCLVLPAKKGLWPSIEWKRVFISLGHNHWFMDEHETQSKQIKPSMGLLWERLKRCSEHGPYYGLWAVEKSSGHQEESRRTQKK